MYGKPHAYVFYITAPNERPAYYWMSDFVWAGENMDNFDSDGNAEPDPDTRLWTELTLITRDQRKERFDVDPVQDDPLILKVKSEKESLAARAAYALAVYTDGGVSDSPDGPFDSPDVLIPRLGESFDLAAALRNTPWLSKRT